MKPYQSREAMRAPVRRWFAPVVIALAVLLPLMAGCAVMAPEGAQAQAPAGTPPPVVTPTVTMPAPPTATATVSARPSASATVAPTPTPTMTPTPLPPLIAIDPGHGLPDWGARHFTRDGTCDLYEAAVVLDVALRLRDILLDRGYRVYLTHETNERINLTQDINEDGYVDNIDEALARVDAINLAAPDLLLSIHLNGYDDRRYGGTCVYYCADRPFADDNLRLAQAVHARILEAFADLGYEVRDRGVMDDNELEEPGEPGEHIIILGPETKRSARSTSMPGALSEMLFITNDAEAALAADPAALDRFAQAYAQAVDDYFASSEP